MSKVAIIIGAGPGNGIAFASNNFKTIRNLKVSSSSTLIDFSSICNC
jgi:hypothetical protein